MSEKTKLWYLENFSMLSTLKPDEMVMMDSMAKMKNAEKNQVIYFPEDNSNSIYLLKSGKVKISKLSPDGKEVILAFLYPGEVFGELSVTGQEKREEIAEATEDTEICIVNLDDVKTMMQKNSSFNFSITKLIGLRFKKIQNRFESLIFKNSEERIFAFLNELTKEHGMSVKGNPEEFLIRLKITHDEIGKLTATSRQTVTSTLNKLQNDNIIIYDRKNILIKKHSVLSEY